MIVNFATKPNMYGRREYLIVDTDRKTFNRFPNTILAKSDLLEISQIDLRRIRETAERTGFSEEIL